jgi:tetraacyldisaccharide 4'-kinase
MISLNPYSLLIDLKNYLYDQHYFKQFHPHTRVISIGNLNTGGSGKTPLTQYLASLVPEKKILIVCRSYKASLSEPARVDLLRAHAADIYGDEACLLKQVLPQCDVWSGPSKSETVKAAVKNNTYDFIFIDDGFSHRKLFRHKDIVLVDLSRDKSHYKLLPFGHMREDWKTLSRSHLVVFTKAEGQSDSQVKFFIDQVSPFQKNIVHAQMTTILESKNKNIYLVTGLGNPEKLKNNLQDLGYQVSKHQFYPDHYSFPESEQLDILKNAKAHSELQLVMTAKDRVKITHPELLQRIQCADLSVSMADVDRKIFYDTILS